MPEVLARAELAELGVVVTTCILDDCFGLDIFGKLRRANHGHDRELRTEAPRHLQTLFKGLFPGLGTIVAQKDLLKHGLDSSASVFGLRNSGRFGSLDLDSSPVQQMTRQEERVGDERRHECAADHGGD